jgi:predicted nucleic acid-binding protein
VIERAAVDVSVALKWVLDDEDALDEALGLRDEMIVHRRLRLFAPRLFAYEAVNAMLMAARRGRISHEDALEGAQALLAIGIELVDPPMAYVAALGDIAGLTAYDAAYVVVAERCGGILWTDDGPVLRCLCDDSARARIAAAMPGFPLPVARKVSTFGHSMP